MKPKVAFYWCASCGGCEEAVVDLGEAILDVVAAVDIVLWPVAMDFKKADIEAMEDGSITAAFINGAIRTTEQEEWVRMLRKKAQFVLAFGSCAQMGGIPGLANFSNHKEIFEEVYKNEPSMVNPESVTPQRKFGENGRTVTLPGFYDSVRTLDQTIDVDYYVPGCPPTPKMLAETVQTLLSGVLPPKGTVLAPDKALCMDCPRRDSKPEKLAIPEFKRPWQILIDEDTCLLAQGLVCMGPATRSGCDARCIEGNMPCTGCFGPTSRVRDFGSKALSAIASLAASNDEDEIIKILAGIPDPAGTFYRYSLAASPLRRRKM
jgi:F420-non-reducing hydrogenase small subunit